MSNIDNIVALPGRGGLISYKGYPYRHIVMVNQEGKITGEPYTYQNQSPVTGLLYMDNWVYIIQIDGTISKISQELCTKAAPTGKLQAASLKDVDDLYMTSTCKVGEESIYPGVVIHDGLLLLTNYDKGTVFTFNMVTETVEEVKLSGLRGPSHVSCFIRDGEPVCVVTEGRSCSVGLYNSDWKLVRKINRESCQQGQVSNQEGHLSHSLSYHDEHQSHPMCAILLPNDHLLVAEFYKRTITEFTWEGEYVKDLMTFNEDSYIPWNLNFQGQTLWVLLYDRKKRVYSVSHYEIFE